MSFLNEKMSFRIYGDSALLLELGDSITPEINRAVRKVSLALLGMEIKGVKEVLPAYRSLLIRYDIQKTSPDEIVKVITAAGTLKDIPLPPPEKIKIPVCYGGEMGPDLNFVATYNHLTPASVIALHTSVTYDVRIIGFTPGFPYLGGLPEKLHTPRLKSPRSHVLKGSVGIAKEQTGIYSVNSPGGWQIIGRTNVALFNPHASKPFLLRVGDQISFYSISEEAFHTCEKVKG